MKISQKLFFNYQISSNMHLISSSGLDGSIQQQNGCVYSILYTIQIVTDKDTDQAASLHRLICAFVFYISIKQAISFKCSCRLKVP